MTTYRWNVSAFAEGYDEAAQHIHPHYVEVQDQVLAQLAPWGEENFLVVDAGGGSGRLVERVLSQHPAASAIILDQSEAFLALAERRLAEFGDRAHCQLGRLQEDWLSRLPHAPRAVVSMTAIHHLDAAEKKLLFERIYQALEPGGLFINGDEVRPAADDAYLEILHGCATHKRRLIDEGVVPDSMHEILRAWEERNVQQFHAPRTSGDDCHDTIDDQLAWLQACGFDRAECVWHKELWAVMVARK